MKSGAKKRKKATSSSQSDRYTLSRAKAHFSEMVRKVRGGAEVTLYDRETPVARLFPIGAVQVGETPLVVVREPAAQLTARFLSDLAGKTSAVGLDQFDGVEFLLNERRRGRDHGE